MKAEVENACRAYLKKRLAYKQACQAVNAAQQAQRQAENEMQAAGAAIRTAILGSMDKQSNTLWLPFDRTVVIEVQTGYTSHEGIYVHKLEQ